MHRINGATGAMTVVDELDGNLWCGWGMGDPELDGVRVFSREGEPTGHIDLPERHAGAVQPGRPRARNDSDTGPGRPKG